MSSSSSLYFSVSDFCEDENLDKEILKAVAVDLGRKTQRSIAEDHSIGKTTVQKYKKKLEQLDKKNYIIVMNDIYREKLNRALLQDKNR